MVFLEMNISVHLLVFLSLQSFSHPLMFESLMKECIMKVELEVRRILETFLLCHNSLTYLESTASLLEISRTRRIPFSVLRRISSSRNDTSRWEQIVRPQRGSNDQMKQKRVLKSNSGAKTKELDIHTQKCYRIFDDYIPSNKWTSPAASIKSTAIMKTYNLFVSHVIVRAVDS